MNCLRRACLLTALSLLLGLPGPVTGTDALPDDVIPSSKWVNFYGIASALNDAPIPPGAVVVALDTQGTQCAEFTVTDAGWYGLMPCYGDESFTPEDEGASYGEVLQFTVDGLPATAVPISLNDSAVSADTIVTWSGNQDLWQVELHAPALIGPNVSIALRDARSELSWPHELAQVASYEIWRSSKPYFSVGQWGSEKVDTITATSGVMYWTDLTQGPDPTANYFYRVRGGEGDKTPVCTSAPVLGEFNFMLIAETIAN